MTTLAVAARRPVSAISGEGWLLGACAVTGGVLVGLAGVHSGHAFTRVAVPVLLAPLALWLFFSDRYEVTLAVLLLYLGLLDGVVKLTSSSHVATLSRDILLYAIALGAVVRVILRRTPITVPRLAGIVAAWAAVCVIQLANPSDISLVHAAASLRPHLEFVPLFFFGYFVLRSERRLAGVLLLLLVVAAVNGVVDLIESQVTPAQLASWGPGYARLERGTATSVARVFVTATGQTAVRPPGLGGFDGFGGAVGMIALPGAIALLSSARRTAKLGWALIPATILTIAGIVSSQTRVDVVAAVIVLFTFLALTLTSRRGLLALMVTACISLAGYLVVSAFVSSSANRYASIAPSKLLGTAETARGNSLALVRSYVAHYPLGAGIGSVGAAAASPIGGTTLSRGLNGENELNFLLVETGIPGLLVMCALMFAIIKAGLGVRLVADPGLQRCLMAFTAVLITLLVVWLDGPVTSASPSSPYIWLSGGCLAYWYAEVRAGRVPTRPRRVRASLATR